MRSLLLLLVAASLSLAGCMTPATPAADADGEDLAPASTPRAKDAPAREEDHDHRTHSHAGAFEWAPADAAVVRPGVQVVSETGQCTSNFLFLAPDGVSAAASGASEDADASAGAFSVYLGLAAHCFEGLEIGAPVDIADGAASGTLAYSSWLTMAEVDEKDADAREYNDFALVLLADEDRAKANPSMLHFGGPVGLSNSSETATGDKVLTYGNSGLRQQTDPLSWHEGYVVETSAWTSTVYTVTPGIPGDSGSGVLDAQGRALGIVVTLTILPLAGSNGVTHLDMALAYAAEHAGLELELATAELLDAGMLPSA